MSSEGALDLVVPQQHCGGNRHTERQRADHGSGGLREAVFAGLGLCVASEWMFQPDLDRGRVKQVLPAWILPSLDLWAAFPTGRRASAKARAFAAFVEDQLRIINKVDGPIGL
jgi:DNA-binding transcriptional LysR family regulator